MQGIIDSDTKIPTDEGQVSIKWIDNALKVAFDNDDFDTAFPSGKPSFMVRLTAKPSEFRQIEKTVEFGGGKGSGGGSSGTRVSQNYCTMCILSGNLEQSKNRL